MYRKHACVELGVRDLKYHTGLVHCPSGRFFANAAWIACAVLAHNLYRWINHHTGQAPPNGSPTETPSAPASFASPQRIVNHAGQLILRLPTDWPYWEAQPDGRMHFWGEVTLSGETQPRYLRVVTLADGTTLHNAFLDRRFKP